MATLDLPFLPVALAQQRPALADRTGHVWRVALDCDLAPWRGTLSAEEQARAAKMKHEGARRTFVNARIALRLILASYTQVAAAQIPIAIGEHGKPYLDLAGAPHFNLSHTGTLALVAITEAGPVGVDVEMVRPVPRLDSLASRFFAPHEIAALRALPEPDRLDAFHACWTCKEAFVKAEGTGIANALADFEVGAPPQDAALLSLRGDAAAAQGYTLHAFRPAQDAWGATCIAAPGVALSFFELVPE